MFVTNEACLCLKVHQDLPLPIGVCLRSLPSGLLLLVCINPGGFLIALSPLGQLLLIHPKLMGASHRSSPTGHAYVHRHKLMGVCHLPLFSSSSSLVNINPWGFLIANCLKPTGLVIAYLP